jgi:ABC-type phosphate/phosphonate transport system ATPase subunit
VILMGHGEEGAAKSTLKRLIKRLVDPSAIETLTLPTDLNQLTQILAHNYIAYFDNVSYIPDWLSDQLGKKCKDKS